MSPGFGVSLGFEASFEAGVMGFCMLPVLPVFFGGRPIRLPEFLLADGPDGVLLEMASREVIARLTIDDSLARRNASGSSSSSSENWTVILLFLGLTAADATAVAAVVAATTDVFGAVNCGCFIDDDDNDGCFSDDDDDGCFTDDDDADDEVVTVTGGGGGGFGLGGSGMYFGRTGFFVMVLVDTLARVSGFLPCTKCMNESRNPGSTFLVSATDCFATSSAAAASLLPGHGGPTADACSVPKVGSVERWPNSSSMIGRGF